jgi:hypothetical protein
VERKEVSGMANQPGPFSTSKDGDHDVEKREEGETASPDGVDY